MVQRAVCTFTALMEYADLGMSMVVAPAYCFQALLIIVLSVILMQFKYKYLFSFATAFIYGNVLDLIMRIIGMIPKSGNSQRLIFYLVGMIICALGVSLLFHTYITPEAYELYVKEIAEKTHKDIHIIKTIYDCCSCLIAIIMSFAFFGFGVFEGVKFGTFSVRLLMDG